MSKRNRRQFLEESMLATAAAVAANSAGKVFAEDEPQSKSPNERMNVVVMGAKGRGGSHIGARMAATQDRGGRLSPTRVIGPPLQQAVLDPRARQRPLLELDVSRIVRPTFRRGRKRTTRRTALARGASPAGRDGGGDRQSADPRSEVDGDHEERQ